MLECLPGERKNEPDDEKEDGLVVVVLRGVGVGM